MSGRGPASAPLVCPSCGEHHQPEERFCRHCAIPLIHDPQGIEVRPIDERAERARKIKPQLAEGKLVRAAWARNQAEAEFIQGLLLEEGIPSLLRRTAGFDVPDFLAAGPRDVLVPEAGLPAAREVLLQAELIDEHAVPTGVAPVRLLAGLLLALAVGALVVWAATALAH
jgi:hypothetical protein